jgi:hypothetical protein
MEQNQLVLLMGLELRVLGVELDNIDGTKSVFEVALEEQGEGVGHPVVDDLVLLGQQLEAGLVMALEIFDLDLEEGQVPEDLLVVGLYLEGLVVALDCLGVLPPGAVHQPEGVPDQLAAEVDLQGLPAELHALVLGPHVEQEEALHGHALGVPRDCLQQLVDHLQATLVVLGLVQPLVRVPRSSACRGTSASAAGNPLSYPN